MTIYYEGDKKPEDAPSWARPVSEAYETPKYIPKEHQKPTNTPDLENTFLRDMLPACMLD